MKILTRILLALLLAAVAFWLVRLGGWLGSLTTQRTAFYWTLNHIAAWAGATIAGLAVIFQR